MTTIQELLEQLSPPRPAVLNHYTTQGGLLGIIQNKEIWATHTQYLNDSREFTHAIGLAKDILSARIAEEVSETRKSALMEMAESVDGQESINVCVASFSEDADSLSQWRAYSGTAGFCCTFASDDLATWAAVDRFSLIKCIYDELRQRQVLEQLIDIVLAEIETWKPEFDGDEPLQGGSLAAYLNQVAPAMKDPAFAAEREWRLVSGPMMVSLPRYGYREGKSMLVPYYRMPLESDTAPFSIQSVTVGPAPNMKQSSAAVRGLLVKHKLVRPGSSKVTASAIPYRNW